MEIICTPKFPKEDTFHFVYNLDFVYEFHHPLWGEGVSRRTTIITLFPKHSLPCHGINFPRQRKVSVRPPPIYI